MNYKKITLASVALTSVLALSVVAKTEVQSEYNYTNTTTSSERKIPVIVSDDAIRQSLDKAFDYYDELDDDVNFKVKDGVVTLTGTVDNQSELQLAEDLSYKVEGVGHVVNKLHSEESSITATSTNNASQNTRTYEQSTTKTTIK